MPANTPRGTLKRLFPNSALDVTSIKVTSPIDGVYNCAAWVVGITHGWVQPLDYPGKYVIWPVAKEGSSVNAYGKMFAYYGFVDCDDGELEIGFEKIVIYGNAGAIFTHVAKQLPDGRWTSKLGGQSDVTHRTPETLAGSEYGQPLKYMRRSV